jgi:hypothetical protein
MLAHPSKVVINTKIGIGNRETECKLWNQIHASICRSETFIYREYTRSNHKRHSCHIIDSDYCT